MAPPLRSSAIARARVGAPQQWTSRSRQSMPMRNATTHDDPNTDTLTAMMSFISTLVYASSHSCRRCHPQSHFHLHRRHRVPVAQRPDRSDSFISYISNSRSSLSTSYQQRRHFHNYFVTHLPSSSVHPDPRMRSGPHHKLPRSASTPHTPGPDEASPAAAPEPIRSPAARELTVVRIPLRSAKHHFGAHNSRGQRKYNEDTNQAGTIDLPAFARRVPVSLSRSSARNTGEGSVADSKSSGDPQIFYFGVFDGHGGTECSEFLRDELHGYIEDAAVQFGLGSSLRRDSQSGSANSSVSGGWVSGDEGTDARQHDDKKRGVDMKGPEDVKSRMNIPEPNQEGRIVGRKPPTSEPIESVDAQPVTADVPAALRLERELLSEYKDTVGGYFRRFKPAHFSITKSSLDSTSDPSADAGETPGTDVTIESVLTYAFLRADLDFITAQARKPDPDDPKLAESPVNNDEVLGAPHHVAPNSGRRHRIGGPTRFKGGSTASVALISTPTPAPFWQPSASSTLLVAHVGDTRALLCETATGLARALTSDHHPSSPAEARRLSRFLGSSVATDSFGEERFSGLANSRAFGDLQSKRVGVSAEPELCRTEMGPAEYSFLVLVSDGVSGSLSDQEIVDVVKEAKTPEQGGRDVVDYATEVSADGDNATCLVVRLGGWERRSEGGLGSLGTKEIRDIRRTEAQNPRGRRR